MAFPFVCIFLEEVREIWQETPVVFNPLCETGVLSVTAICLHDPRSERGLVVGWDHQEG